MASREEGALVVKLPREAGKRESRYMHLFSGEVDIEALASAAPALAGNSSSRLDELEQEVASLKAELSELRSLVEQLTE
jgi:uncharacterized protein YceH (UPF0502 family)